MHPQQTCWLTRHVSPRELRASRSVRAVAPSLAIIGPAVSDAAMGGYSALARHIVAGLQDPAVRGALVRALRAAEDTSPGLDLVECDSSSTVGRLFAAGARRGGTAAAALCAGVRSGGGSCSTWTAIA